MMPKPAEPPQTTQRAFEGWWYRWHFIQDRNSDGNLYVRYLYWNDDRWNWNNNWLDNDWNDDNPAALRATLFISRSVSRLGRVLLCQLSIPSAEHPADLFKRNGECGVLFCIKRFGLPEYKQEDFQCIKLADS